MYFLSLHFCLYMIITIIIEEEEAEDMIITYISFDTIPMEGHH